MTTIFDRFQYAPWAPQGPREAIVYFNESAGASETLLKWVLWVPPGGWTPDMTGGMKAMLDTDDGWPTLLTDMYNAGWAVISMGYTLEGDTGPAKGLFHERNFKRGADGHLVIDEAKLDYRCGEADVILCLQAIRCGKVSRARNLDTRPGSGGIFASSAGGQLASFATFRERCDPTATHRRFRTSTRVAFFMGQQTFGSFNAYKPQWPDNLQNHVAGVGGERVRYWAQSDPVSRREASPLWIAQQAEREGVQLPPMYVSSGRASELDTNAGETYTAGPYDYDNFTGILDDFHASDTVKAYSHLDNHHGSSVFQITTTQADQWGSSERAARLAFAESAIARVR